MTRYRFRGIFLLFLMGHATACATTTSTRTIPTSTTNWQSPGTIPKFIEETQPDRVHVFTEDGTVYEVTRPFVEGDKIVSVDSISVPIADIVELRDVTSLLETPGNTNTGWVQLGGLGWGLLAALFSSETEEEEKGLLFDLGKLLCQSKGGSNC